MTGSTLPEYCLQCSWLFSKMGACRPPNVSLFFSIMSFIPYLLIFLFIGLSIIMRGRTQIKMTLLMITAYLFADRIVKNLLAMPRPEGACKTSYGFPSSHMVALCVYIFEMMPRCNKSQKFFFLFLIISQAMARIHLKYHTWSQVIGGVIFAMAYTYIFNMYINHKIECIPNFKKHNFAKNSINFST